MSRFYYRNKKALKQIIKRELMAKLMAKQAVRNYDENYPHTISSLNGLIDSFVSRQRDYGVIYASRNNTTQGMFLSFRPRETKVSLEETLKEILPPGTAYIKHDNAYGRMIDKEEYENATQSISFLLQP